MCVGTAAAAAETAPGRCSPQCLFVFLADCAPSARKRLELTLDAQVRALLKSTLEPAVEQGTGAVGTAGTTVLSVDARAAAAWVLPRCCGASPLPLERWLFHEPFTAPKSEATAATYDADAAVDGLRACLHRQRTAALPRQPQPSRHHRADSHTGTPERRCEHHTPHVIRV